MMNIWRLRAALLVTTVMAGTVLAGPVSAEETKTDTTPGGDIVVTGSRVSDPNATAISPIVTLSAEDIRLQGSSRIEDVLNALPSISPSQGGQVNGFGNGTATVDLRHLGPTRTLVLIDNKRLLPGDPIAPAADLNNIPAALIQRVDVLTGGASTVYGSDAVAGVVNFVMKHDFQGLVVDGSLGFDQHDNNATSIQSLVRASGSTPATGNAVDGLTKDINITFGANTSDGRGNVTAYMGYRQTNPVSWTKRDFSGCVIQSNSSGDYCGGSGGTAPSLLIPANGSFLTIDKTSGLLRNYTSADAYNFAPGNELQRADSRYIGGAMAHYDISPSMEVYGDLSFMSDRTVRQLAPDGVYNTFNIACSDPRLTADEKNTFCTSQGLASTATTPITVYRRNVEGGNRSYRIDHQSFRGDVGLRGKLSPEWSYDVYAQYGRTQYNLMQSNALSVSKINKAMDAVTDPATGKTVCASVLNGSDPSCVVYNPFTLGGVTQAALNYMTINAFESGSTTETVLSGALTGKLGQYGIVSPWAQNGATIALGAEYRRETLSLETDEAYASGDIEGTPVAGNAGSFNVKEVFGEFRMPLVERIPLFYSLALEGGFRHSDYSTAGNAETYKVGVEWSPVPSLHFRGGYNRAVRAPNLVELFTLQSQSQTPAADPCAGTTPTATRAQCANSGVTASQYGTIVANPSGQYTSLTGGNVNLRPEVADTFTAGAAFTPTGALRGLTVSVDYFNIKVNDYITTITGALALNQCVATGNPVYCNLVHRDPTSGSLWIGTNGYIDGRNTNAGSLQTSGIDFNLNYTHALGQGRIGTTFSGTWLSKLESTPLPGVTKYDCAGYFGTTCGQPAPHWRHKARVTWYAPFNVDFSVAWRYIGTVKSDNLIPAIGGTAPAIDQRISARSYFDLAAIWTIKEKYSLNLTVNNAFDKTPPIIGANNITSYSNGGTYPGVYDLLGRYISVGFKMKY